MADDKQEPQEDKPKSKLVPILLGVILVVGGAVATVAMTSPPAEEEPVEVDIEKLAPTRYAEQFEKTFTLGGGQQDMAKFTISFDYKAEDVLKATELIQRGWVKAEDALSELMLGKSGADINSKAGFVQLKAELKELLNEAFFGVAEDEEPIKAMVCDVYIPKFIIR